MCPVQFDVTKLTEGEQCMLHSFDAEINVREAVIEALKQSFGCARNYVTLVGLLTVAAYLGVPSSRGHLRCLIGHA